MTEITNERTSAPRIARKAHSKVCAVLAVALLVGLLGAKTGGLEAVLRFGEPETLSAFIASAGPLAVILLLALAVVVSPIPSGPVAMAAGAYLGTLEGGLYTAIGAVLGATTAFCLSRWLGYQPLANCDFPLAQWVTRARTQNKLALAVLVSRLIPFISFDAVSYVAGLTTITFRNFVLATTLGVLPASFAFAALGAGMTTSGNATLMVMACSITIGLPLVCLAVQRFRKA